jgi:hypothetical protein
MTLDPDLDPDRYECPRPKHDVDLTLQVRKLVKEIMPPVASDRRPPLAYDRKLRRRRPSAKTRFEVIVRCPGTGPDDSHDLICSGTWIL